MMVHLDKIYFKFECQGHRVKVTLIKLIILTVGHQIFAMINVWY